MKDKLRFLCILGMLIVVLGFSPMPTAADPGRQIDSVRMEPGDKIVEDFVLLQGEVIYVRFHITYGPAVYFFIVDEDGNADIEAARVASTIYKEETYLANDGEWNYISFVVPHSSTWYVWFSKVTGAPYADSTATIEGHIRHDTDGPVFTELTIPENNITGTMVVQYIVEDQGHLIERIELRINNEVVDYIEDPVCNHYTTGFQTSGSLMWDSTTDENGEYSVQLVAFDIYQHATWSSEVHRYVNNGFWNYPMNLILVGIIGVILVLIGVAYWKSR